MPVKAVKTSPICIKKPPRGFDITVLAVKYGTNCLNTSSGGCSLSNCKRALLTWQPLLVVKLIQRSFVLPNSDILLHSRQISSVLP
ncbi:unnamed protein product [Trichobilharzia szidati]|nr:unnamed protein product [Trichobilharzia szidati]